MLQQNIFPLGLISILWVLAGFSLVEFEPRLRLEVTAAESDVPRVLQAIQRIPGASAYPQVIDARLPLAAGGTEVS